MAPGLALPSFALDEFCWRRPDTMTRRDWLLLLLGAPESVPLDPVRVQKSMFLFVHEDQLPVGERYEFTPYDYGPFSSEIYADLDSLVAAGLAERLDTPGYTWKQFRASADGVARARGLQATFDNEQRQLAERLFELKARVLAFSFRDLLTYVYDRYPEFARNSIFR